MAKVTKTRVIGARTPRPIYSGFSGALARVYDAVVGVFAPSLQKQMRQARMKSAAVLAFESAVVDRMMPREQTASADAEVLPNLATMRARSRRHTQDDGHAESAVQVYVDAVVGPGIKPQCAVSSDSTGSTEDVVQAWRTACERYFEKWSDGMADASGHGDFYAMQALAARTRKVDGECFTHTVVGEDGSMSLEFIDPDRIETPNAQAQSKDVRGGVKVDAKGRPLGYWVAKEHPDDLATIGLAEFVFVPATEGELSVVQHHFRRKRVGQTRGYPDSAPAQSYLEHLHHYLKSEIIGARAAANYALFVKKAINAGDQGLDPVVETNGGTTETVYHEALEAGTIAYLNDGEEPFAFNPNRPGASDEFVKRMLRAVAAANGMSYETMARDYGGMNYSSMRGLLKQEQRGYDADRELLNRQFNTPVWRNVIRHGIQTGALTPPPSYLNDPEPWLAVNWIPPAIGWVDPVKEIQAAKEAIDANLSTPWHEAGRAGLDPIEILEAKARFLARAADIESEYGLPAGSLTGVASGDGKLESEQVGQPDEQDDGTSPDATSDNDTSDDVQTETENKDVKAQLDAIGVAMRSGLISPQQADEESTRAKLGLPPMSDAVLEAWKAEPVRRPVTLSPLKDAATNQAKDIEKGDGEVEGDEAVPPEADNADEGSKDQDEDAVPQGTEDEDDA